jgi:hypothetical protein
LCQLDRVEELVEVGDVLQVPQSEYIAVPPAGSIRIEALVPLRRKRIGT